MYGDYISHIFHNHYIHILTHFLKNINIFSKYIDKMVVLCYNNDENKFTDWSNCMWNFLKGKAKEEPKRDKRGRGRPRKNIEDMEKELKYNEKKTTTDGYIELFKTDPDFKRQMIAKTFGFNLAAIDEAKKNRDKIEANINEEALSAIMSDPVLRKQLAEKRAREILGEAEETRNDEDGDLNYSEDPIQNVLRQKRDYEELEQEFGGSRKDSTLRDLGSVMHDILDTPAGQMLVTGLMGKMNKGGGNIAPTRTIVLMVDGHPTEVTEDQYRQLEASGKLLPVAQDVKTPQIENKKAESPKMETPKATDMDTSENLESTDEEENYPTSDNDRAVYASDGDNKQLATLPDVVTPEQLIKDALEMTKQEPNVLVDFMYGEVNKSTPYSEMIWEMLLTANYDFIANMCRAYTEHPSYGEYVKTLLSKDGRVYVESVLQLVKQKDIEEQKKLISKGDENI